MGDLTQMTRLWPHYFVSFSFPFSEWHKYKNKISIGDPPLKASFGKVIKFLHHQTKTHADPIKDIVSIELSEFLVEPGVSSFVLCNV